VSSSNKRVTKRKRPSPTPTAVPPHLHHVISHTLRRLAILQEPSDLIDPIFGDGLGRPMPIAKPSWQNLALTDDHYESLQQQHQQEAQVTCLNQAATSTMAVMGMATGQVALVATQPKLLPVSWIHTSAYRRHVATTPTATPTNTNNSSIHTNSSTNTNNMNTKTRKYVQKVFDQALQATCLANQWLVVASGHDLECWNVLENKMHWNIPIDSETIKCHSLQIHPTSHEILCSMLVDSLEESPLWRIDSPLIISSATNNETTTTSATTITVTPIPTLPFCSNYGHAMMLHSKCTAVWDKSNSERYLLVGLVGPSLQESSIHLLLVHAPTDKVVQQTILPHKSMKQLNIESLRQSPKGKYTLVGSTRGVRLLETSTLTTLKVYGDQFALHGHSVIWQDAMFVRTDSSPVASTYIINNNNSNNTDNEDEAHWTTGVQVLGIPHAHRAPTELANVLHVWDLWGDSKIHTTIVGPKTGGFAAALSIYENRGIVAAPVLDGQVVVLKPTVQSDFAGIMYPPGYRIMDDNVEYIEDEDECDVLVDGVDDEVDSDDSDEEELQTAMRLSMVKDPEIEEELMIDIVHGGPDISVAYPSYPVPRLKHRLDEGDTRGAVTEATPDKEAWTTSTLKCMPHHAAMIIAENKPCTKEEFVAPQPTVRQKRNKAAALEALRKASLNPALRKWMISKELWSLGEGCALKATAAAAAAADTNATASDENINADAGPEESREEETPTESREDKELEPLQSVGESAFGTLVAEHSVESKGNGELSAPSYPALVVDPATNLYRGNEADENPSVPMMVSPIIDSDDATSNCIKVVDETKIADQVVEVADSINGSKHTMPEGTHCAACKGRWVFHTCGARSIPVDYDELKRAEEEQKFQQEEDVKKQRAAKRKVADAKRRVMKKKKRAEEEAMRQREEDERCRLEEDGRRQVTEFRRQNPLHNKEKRRAEMLERLQHDIEEGQAGPRPSVVLPLATYSKSPVRVESEAYAQCYQKPACGAYAPREVMSSHEQPSYEYPLVSQASYPVDLQYAASERPRDAAQPYDANEMHTDYGHTDGYSNPNERQVSIYPASYEQETYSNEELLQAATYTTDNTSAYATLDTHGEGYENTYGNDDSLQNDARVDGTCYAAQSPAYHASSSYLVRGGYSNDPHAAYSESKAPLHDSSQGSYCKVSYATPNSAQSDAIDALAALASAATSRSFESTENREMTPSHYDGMYYQHYDANENANHSRTYYGSDHHESWGPTNADQSAPVNTDKI
jgi:hypothetical protein